MKDEIKEILDNLIRYKNEDNKMKWSPEDILTIDDVWLLLDYITNLQEENERLNNIIKEVREYNEQIIKDTKDFYRPTEDIIYSGDCLIDIATQNLEILDKENDNETI